MRSDESAEMYLESILILQEKQDFVRSVDVAHETGYSKPSVSRAMGLLKNRNMIRIDDEGHIELTTEGYDLAHKILDRHRSLSKILVLFGVSETVAAEDACRIEHVISDESMQALKNAYPKIKNLNFKEDSD